MNSTLYLLFISPTSCIAPNSYLYNNCRLISSRIAKSFLNPLLGRILLSVALLCFAPLSYSQNHSENKIPNIVATTGMIGDVVKNIGGQYIKVQNLMSSGVDPHLYRPTSKDATALRQADVVFYNGYYLEGRMDSILKKMARSQAIYAVAENVDTNLIYADSERSVIDPHIWMDVMLWRQVTEFIYLKLKHHFPSISHHLSENYQHYDEQLSELNQHITKQMSIIPKNRRILITAHDAFAYFGRSYKVKVVGLQGINTADEFGINDMIRLQRIIIENEVPAIFLESSVPPKFMQSMKKGLAQKNVSVSIGGELFSDAMGKEDTVEGTYVGMMKHNANIISEALK